MYNNSQRHKQFKENHGSKNTSRRPKKCKTSTTINASYKPKMHAIHQKMQVIDTKTASHQPKNASHQPQLMPVINVCHPSKALRHINAINCQLLTKEIYVIHQKMQAIYQKNASHQLQ